MPCYRPPVLTRLNSMLLFMPDANSDAGILVCTIWSKYVVLDVMNKITNSKARDEVRMKYE